ncbi:SPR [Cordylochernes scorpioides]|uniref:SPR n=1 Tax=Cordylochernes scorpioides TaxID=51811 RepID=A0ABY6KFJ7_9ARAC|nr:SPR [Cordylochernes scorpioides]
MEEQFWNRRFFILITGASRGFGRTLAHIFSSKVSKDSQIIILGRNKEKLESVKEEIKNDNSNISVNTVNIDLAKPNAAEFQKILEPFKETNYDVYILINNVGSVGDISKDASSFNDNEELTKYYELNVNSPIVMTSVFLKLF